MLYSAGVAYLCWEFQKTQFKVLFQIVINVGKIILHCRVQLNSIYIIPLFSIQPILCPLKALYPIPVFHLPLKSSKCHFQSDNMEMSFPDWNYCFPLLSMILISGATWARSICLSLHSFPACAGILFCNAIQYEEQYAHRIDDAHYVSFLFS